MSLETVAIATSCFTLGFTFAVALMARASVRPQARKILSKIGIMKNHKAFVPKKETGVEI